jgi:hypothetical protein
VTVNFKELTPAERNGSAYSEVSYSYNASTGQSGPIKPGQTVGGFANGTRTTITVIANSTVAPSSDSSPGSSTTPYGSPGTPTASGQDGAENQKSLTFSWSSPSASTHDVATTQISLDGGGWQDVNPSGSRTVNTGGYNEPHSLRVRTLNSKGDVGGIATASAKSGPPQRVWTTRVKTSDPNFVRTCTYTLGGSNYNPNNFTCDGVNNGDVPPWFYKNSGETIVVKCFIVQSDHWTPNPINNWYRVEPGSNRNVGRYVVAGHTALGEPGPAGVPPC